MTLQMAFSVILVCLIARCRGCAPFLILKESAPGHDATPPWTSRGPSQFMQSHLSFFWVGEYSNMLAQTARRPASRFDMTHLVMTGPGAHACVIRMGKFVM